MNFGERCLIFPKEIWNRKFIKKKIVIRRNNNVILKGRVVDYKGNPMAYAIVEINKISYPNKVENLGYTVCSKNGEYLICIEKYKDVFYEFKVYSGLKS